MVDAAAGTCQAYNADDFEGAAERLLLSLLPNKRMEHIVNFEFFPVFIDRRNIILLNGLSVTDVVELASILQRQIVRR